MEILDIHRNLKTLIVTLFFTIVRGQYNHVPRFQQELEVLTTTEEEPIGTDLFRAYATDANGDELLYDISGDTGGYFVINRDTGDVKIAKVIDKEKLTSDTVDFQVYAYEKLNPSHKATQRVSVHVLDINDNAPEFSKNEYYVNISELSPADTFVEKMGATDPDESSELFYKIIAGNEDKSFKIDHSTGVVKLSKSLDYEKKMEHHLIVAVEDSRPRDPDKHVVQASLFVRVIDEDDNGASFSKRNYTTFVVEGTHRKHDVVAHVHAFDRDKGIRNPVKYWIDPVGNTGSVFQVDSKGYVTVFGTLDRETKDLYELTLMAQEITDAPQPRHPPTKTKLYVHVEDVNDNYPQFTAKMYYAEVMENMPIGTIIKTVTAVDADKGENGFFTYKLRNQGQVFGINQKGEVFITTPLDKETRDNYKFQVVAAQKGQPDQTADITVIVLDDNDHSPEFIRPLYKAELKENDRAGNIIVTVSANDKDYGDNAKVRYSIVPDADGSSKCFNVDTYTGDIKTNCTFDREEKEEITLLLEATDSGPLAKQKSDQTVVKITIIDANDQIPMFEETEFVKTLEYDVEVPWHLVTLKAIDDDSGDFGTVQYRVVHGNELGLFHLDQSTGSVEIIESIVRLSGQHFELTIEAYDNKKKQPYNVSPQPAVIKVTVDQGKNTVVLVLKSTPNDVRQREDQLISELRQLLQIGIVIDNVVKKDSQPQTKVFFHGYEEEGYKVVAKDEIIANLDKLRTSSSFFHRFNVTNWYAHKGSASVTADDEKKDKADKWHPIIYAVLGFSALIAILGMIGIIYLIRVKRRGYDDSHESQASTRMLPTPSRKSFPNSAYWMSDDGFESVSQGVPDSYMERASYHERSFDRSFDRMDPVIYGRGPSPYQDSNTFCDRLEDDYRPPSRGSNCSSRASSVFAPSSAMTVYKAPNPIREHGQRDLQATVLRNPANHRGSRRSTSSSFFHERDRERRLSVILDDDGKTKTIIDRIDDPFDDHNDSGHDSNESQSSSC